MRILIVLVLLTGIFSSPAWAHPEFQRYFKKVSGRTVNCALCHVHSDGPEGLRPGQIGSLDQEGLNALGLARQAFKPGFTGQSPVLNEFGNLILKTLGKDKILELKQRPELLSGLLPKTSDLDKDGIPDAEEINDGTNPLNALDGHPWKLFVNNLARNWFDILMVVLATGFGLFGLYNMIRWLSVKARIKE